MKTFAQGHIIKLTAIPTRAHDLHMHLRSIDRGSRFAEGLQNWRVKVCRPHHLKKCVAFKAKVLIGQCRVRQFKITGKLSNLKKTYWVTTPPLSTKNVNMCEGFV